MKVQIQNSSGFYQPKLKPKTAIKLQKIKELLSEALSQIHSQETSSKSSIDDSPGKKRSDQSSECEEIQEVMTSLRRGYLVIKHSANTRNFHPKFVYVSQDGRYLCWKSLECEDERRIQLISITRIVKDGVQFFLKASCVKNINHCLVVFSETKTLQFELGSKKEVEYFRYELERIVKFSRNMSLNYKYCKTEF